MINKSQRNKIKKVLGGHYCEPIEEALHKKGIRNRHGRPHSKTMINNVMNGQPHKEIEAVIFELLEDTLKKQKAENKRREALLAQTKTAAATAV